MSWSRRHAPVATPLYGRRPLSLQEINYDPISVPAIRLELKPQKQPKKPWEEVRKMLSVSKKRSPSSELGSSRNIRSFSAIAGYSEEHQLSNLLQLPGQKLTRQLSDSQMSFEPAMSECEKSSREVLTQDGNIWTFYGSLDADSTASGQSTTTSCIPSASRHPSERRLHGVSSYRSRSPAHHWQEGSNAGSQISRRSGSGIKSRPALYIPNMESVSRSSSRNSLERGGNNEDLWERIRREDAEKFGSVTSASRDRVPRRHQQNSLTVDSRPRNSSVIQPEQKRSSTVNVPRSRSMGNNINQEVPIIFRQGRSKDWPPPNAPCVSFGLAKLIRGEQFEVHRYTDFRTHVNSVLRSTPSNSVHHDVIAHTLLKLQQVAQSEMESDGAMTESNLRHSRSIKQSGAPSPNAIVFRNASQEKQQQGNYRRIPCVADIIVQSQLDANTLLLKEDFVEFTEGRKTTQRYLLLFNNVLVVAKQRGTGYRMKFKIPISDLWVSEKGLAQVSDTLLFKSRSLVVGWPVRNIVMTWTTSELRDQWLAVLGRCVQKHQADLSSQSLVLKVHHVQTDGTELNKCLTITPRDTAAEILFKSVESLRLPGHSAYEFAVKTQKDTPRALIGHEFPFQILLHYLREQRIPMSPNVICQDELAQYGIQLRFVVRETSMLESRVAAAKSTGSLRSSAGARIRQLMGSRPSSSALPHSGRRDVTDAFNRQENIVDVIGEELTQPIVQTMLCSLYTTGYETCGVFRRSAAQTMLKEAKRLIAEEVPDAVERYSAVVISSLLKEFLRSLSDSVLCSVLYTDWLAASCLDDESDVKLRKISNLLDKLPEENRILLSNLVHLLHHISLHSAANNMTAYNLAVCVAPSLLWCEEAVKAPQIQVNDTETVVRLVHWLITRARSLFPGETWFTSAPDQLYETPQFPSCESIPDPGRAGEPPVRSPALRSRDSGLSRDNEDDSEPDVEESPVREVTARLELPNSRKPPVRSASCKTCTEGEHTYDAIVKRNFSDRPAKGRPPYCCVGTQTEAPSRLSRVLASPDHAPTVPTPIVARGSVVKNERVTSPLAHISTPAKFHMATGTATTYDSGARVIYRDSVDQGLLVKATYTPDVESSRVLRHLISAQRNKDAILNSVISPVTKI